MGATTVYNYTISDLKKECKEKTFTYENEDMKLKCLDIKGGKGGFWILIDVFSKKINKGDKTIVFCKCSQVKAGDTYNTTYSFFDADSYPYYFDCPKKFLDQFNPTSKYGIEWKEQCILIQKFNKDLVFGYWYHFKGCNSKYYKILEDHNSKYWIAVNYRAERFRIAKDCIDYTFPGTPTIPAKE